MFLQSACRFVVNLDLETEICNPQMNRHTDSRKNNNKNVRHKTSRRATWRKGAWNYFVERLLLFCCEALFRFVCIVNLNIGLRIYKPKMGRQRTSFDKRIVRQQITKTRSTKNFQTTHLAKGGLELCCRTMLMLFFGLCSDSL